MLYIRSWLNNGDQQQQQQQHAPSAPPLPSPTFPTSQNRRQQQQQQQQQQQGTGLVLTVFLIVNAALGAGLLNFPRAFADAGGVAAGTAVQGVLMVFILGALLILAHCADKVEIPHI